MGHNSLYTHIKFHFDIFNSFRYIHPQKGKKQLKNTILEIIKSLIKSKRFEIQGNKMAHKSIIYVLILCKNFISLFPLCFEIRKFFGKKMAIFYGLQKVYFFKKITILRKIGQYL